MLEADRLQNKRRKDLDLYYRDHLGDLVPLAEAYEPEVDEVVSSIFKKRKMRYLITFVDAMELQDGLKPSAHKILRYMTKTMGYGNLIKGIGIRDINDETAINRNYIVSGIKELCGKDIIRFTVEKGRRTYMVNPTYFYKGSLRSLFKTVRSFDKMPRRTEDLEVEFNNEND